MQRAAAQASAQGEVGRGRRSSGGCKQQGGRRPRAAAQAQRGGGQGGTEGSRCGAPPPPPLAPSPRAQARVAQVRAVMRFCAGTCMSLHVHVRCVCFLHVGVCKGSVS